MYKNKNIYIYFHLSVGKCFTLVLHLFQVVEILFHQQEVQYKGSSLWVPLWLTFSVCSEWEC